jgi:flagellar FliJ protein
VESNLAEHLLTQFIIVFLTAAGDWLMVMAGKKFKFSLDSVLRLRMHETEGARQELSKVMREAERQQRAVDEARTYVAHVAKSRFSGATEQRSLSRFESFRQEAWDRLETARRRLQHLHEMEDDARIQFIERKGAEETLKRLREQEEEQHWREHRAAETQFLDEQAISGFQRQRRAANS